MKKNIAGLIGSCLIIILGSVLFFFSKKDGMAYFAGLIVAIGGIMLIIFITKLNDKNTKNVYFDERQIKARGTAFKISFFVLIVLLICEGVVREITSFNWSSYLVTVSVYIIISFMVFINYSIFNDAYLEINYENKRLSLILLLFGTYNLIVAVGSIFCNEFTENGEASIKAVNLAGSILCLSTFVSLVIKKHIDNKAEEEQ